MRSSDSEEQSEFVAYVTDQPRRWARVSAQRLFSGHGVYRGTRVFAIISRDTLYLRTNDLNRPDFVAAGMGQLCVGKSGDGRIALSYHEVPSDVLEDADVLATWAERAFATALRRDDLQADRRMRALGRKRRGNRAGPKPPKG